MRNDDKKSNPKIIILLRKKKDFQKGNWFKNFQEISESEVKRVEEEKKIRRRFSKI